MPSLAPRASPNRESARCTRRGRFPGRSQADGEFRQSLQIGAPCIRRRNYRPIRYQIGQPIKFDCYDERGVLLLKKGLVIESERALAYMIERGLYAGAEQSQAAPFEHERAAPPSPFHFFDELYLRLNRIFVAMAGKSEEAGQMSDFNGRVAGIAAKLQKMCDIDANAAIGLIHLQQFDRYTVAHPLHRAIVCELVAKRNGIGEQERRRIVCAALTCDLAMVELQEKLVKQADPLSPQQREAIRAHPTESATQLAALGVDDGEWLTAVSQHHEGLGDSGYPGRAGNDQVTLWSRLIHLADIYTAMITPRAYRPGLTARLAMRDVFLTRGKTVDETLSAQLVKELGIYPPGAFVKLINGEVAIVIRRSVDSKAPLVKAVVGPRGRPLARPVVRDTAAKEFAIRDVVERDSIVQIDLQHLWDYKERK